MVDIGDIAVRLQLHDDVVVKERSLFNEGYFLIVAIFRVEDCEEVVQVCKIMNEIGETSWILDRKLQVVFSDKT
jgi:hypothetical protein